MNKIEGAQREQLIADIQRRIETDTQVVGSPERTAVWERGWAEALDRFRKRPVAESLIPAFIHVANPVRWKQEYYLPDDEYNELKHVRKMQRRLASYLHGCSNVYEFGCGTGFNLVEMGDLLPEIDLLCGLDFSPSACELTQYAGEQIGLPIETVQFDMRAPDYTKLRPNSGVFTFGSVEQLAGDFHNFASYLIDNKPSIVVHIEPVIELYDPSNFVDTLAIMFHRKRGYTEGYLPWLQKNVDVTHIERTWFGSTMLEGYNLIIWKPQ